MRMRIHVNKMMRIRIRIHNTDLAEWLERLIANSHGLNPSIYRHDTVESSMLQMKQKMSWLNMVPNLYFFPDSFYLRSESQFHTSTQLRTLYSTVQ